LYTYYFYRVTSNSCLNELTSYAYFSNTRNLSNSIWRDSNDNYWRTLKVPFVVPGAIEITDTTPLYNVAAPSCNTSIYGSNPNWYAMKTPSNEQLYTCVSGVSYPIYLDGNRNSPTYMYYYINGNIQSSIPTFGAC
jgi:hypothetical protein